MLIDGDAIIDQKYGPGIKQLNNATAIEAACFGTVQEWLNDDPSLEIIMTGSVGSNIGWRNAPYVMTPANAASIIPDALRFTARGTRCIILPGVETVGDTGLPGIMRGEETQIFGSLGNESGLACLPGTHAKWVLVDAGVIVRFHSAMTGELMDVIGCNSILLNPPRAPQAKPDAAFIDGAITVRDNPVGLEVLIFTVRSRQVTGSLANHDAEAYLAGLCIGADIRSALLVNPDPAIVYIIGSPALTALYGTALDCFGVKSKAIDGQQAVLSGLVKAYRMLSQ